MSKKKKKKNNAKKKEKSLPKIKKVEKSKKGKKSSEKIKAKKVSEKKKKAIVECLATTSENVIPSKSARILNSVVSFYIYLFIYFFFQENMHSPVK